jgi:hypothetical protein
MALYWAAQAGNKAGPMISEGWSQALVAAGWVLASAAAWWFSEDDPETPWTEGEVDWVPCDGDGEEIPPYPDYE